MYKTGDNIAAISTATGGAIAILRISGYNAFNIAKSVWTPLKKRDTDFHYAHMYLGNCNFASVAPEKAFAVFFKEPESYTGENLVEIHCHGSKLLAEKILKSLIAAGARQAEPGEFTFRAFINGKLDLSQAEAVADIISAKSELALDLAEKQLDGVLKRKINKIRDEIVEIIALCETELDFSEEHDLLIDNNFIQDIEKILKELDAIIKTARDGMIIRDGFKIVIAGHPNAGKSSLFNCLLGRDRAIVTDIPGTTRDTIEEDLIIGSLRATIIDTAGLRDADNLIEKIGIQRTRESIGSADMILWVLDPLSDKDTQIKEMKSHSPEDNTIVVWSKSDLLKNDEIFQLKQLLKDSICISSRSFDGISELREKIITKASVAEYNSKDEFAISTRHETLISEAILALNMALTEMRKSQYEIVAMFLRNALFSIKQITGEVYTPDILDDIFSKFCIGK
ncbi:MAG TPA: tRNA uridine-5-carboxymethylaminomethyl(34) synthesis GTPase MnmE [Victivallales bacterium]|nr:tRNA uridine-5-carboxymethylaminomethyl(34) synthesis GTPase MnmE [Victivallales bacterium]HPO89497.1 tRNA uridine-5-carboxymethylaminomethyl(34) synthesis GTPase MnmE [Victivallales bacterium]HRR29209.1 tRNA uridine-5-carboxymethylaminomethyl(34) synthesis GTPase MnmE [Victivallales bacterium]HRU00893.1 tRNA uridine-5-carboxymethylaminomethyl(34) synthesis GTPase MnmE [Victivallales bacterium]